MLHDIEKVFFIYTGDLAFSGKQEEYLKALDFVEYLKNETDKVTSSESSIICVPGNHDCCFDESKETVRNTLMESINRDTISNADEGIINACCECQDNFREFVSAVQDDSAIKYDDKLLTIYTYDVNGYVIQFNCINTSWLSHRNEIQGKLGFPINKYCGSIFKHGANLSVSLMHHPRIWQSAINARELDDFLNTYSGIIITGHEHHKSQFVKYSLNGKHTEYIEGGVLQDNKNSDISEFNIINVDIECKTETISHYSYSSGDYNCVSEHNVDLKDMDGIVVNSVILTEETSTFIDDVGTILQHRYRDEIYLSDIYVFPDLIDLKINKINMSRDKIYSSKDILCIDDESYKTILQGSEKLGKTTFCKIAYKYFLNKGKIPIIISGTIIDSCDKDELLKIVLKSYLNQYRDKTRDEFNRLDFNNIFLIVDDFDKSKLNTKYKGKLLANISSLFNNILITVGDFFKIEEIVYDEDEKTIVLDKYKQHKLLSFGNLLRADLINKWNLLGRESDLEEEELIKLNEHASRVINTVIGKNLVPSYPIFLLTLLQTIDAGTPYDLKTSSQGYYYSYLITHALSQLKLKNEKINFYHNFLSVLAYVFFERNVKEFTDAEMRSFYLDIKDKYVVTEDYKDLINNLINSKILDKRSCNYVFKYKYTYYYFAAKQLADNIGKDDVRKYILQMSQRAYNEEFANILMFLIHHSKDPFILESILSSAKNIFKEYDPLKLESDVNILNKLIDDIPKMVLKDTSVNQARRDKLARRDEIANIPESDAKQSVYSNYDINEDIDDLDLVKKLNLAFKTIEILGQLVKSYHGAILKTDTVDLATETYLISLRALKSFYIFIEKNVDSIVNEIKSEICEKQLIEKSDIEKFSKEMIFHLCSIVTYGFIKKVSNSIGADNLEEVYNKIYDTYNINAVDVINTSITMDFTFNFPINKINKIKNTFGHHYLVSNLLRRMAIEYLYTFPTDYLKKNQICSSLDISMDTQRLIDATSTQKKFV